MSTSISGYSFLRPHLLIIILSLPVFFISIQRTHDWGGDFSLYIQHAQNIVEGQPYAQNGYIYNEKQAYLSPSAYPPGFPLILSPVIAVFGNDLVALKFWMNVLFFFLSIILFWFYRNSFNTLIAIVLTLLFIYHPSNLEYKGAILSEIPFTLLFVVAVFYYQKNSIKAYRLAIFIGVLAAVLITIRPIGVIFIAGLLLDQLIEILRSRSLARKHLLYLFSMTGTTLVLYTFFTYVLFPLPEDQFLFFGDLFAFTGLYETVLSNLNYNLELIGDFIIMDAGKWSFLSLIIKSAAIVFFILGIFNKILERGDMLEWVTILYILVLLLWPVQTQGFRYIFPIFPFVLYYIVQGIDTIHLNTQINLSYKVLAFSLLAFTFYPSGYKLVSERQTQAPPGPYEETAREVWNYIRQNTPKEARIAYFKPRVVALYTERQGMAPLSSPDVDSIEQNLNDKRMEYLLIHKYFVDHGIKSYVDQLGKDALIWENEDFQFYSTDTIK